MIAGQPNHQVLTSTENGICEFVGIANTINKWPLVIASKFNIPYLLHKCHFGNVCFQTGLTLRNIIFNSFFEANNFLFNCFLCFYFLSKHIFGEIYSVDDTMLQFLDDFECHPSYYTRLETGVVLEDGSHCYPWIYFLKDYRPEMLDLPTIGNYSSYGSHGLRYVERSERDNSNDGSYEKNDVILQVKLFL